MINGMNTKRERWRRRAGVTMLLLGGALAVTFLVSARWWFGYCGQSWLADLGDGTLYVRTVEPSDFPHIGWCVGDNRPPGAVSPYAISWTWWTWGTRQPAWWYDGSAFSVWPLAPLVLLSGAVLRWSDWRASKRIRRGQCPACGYSRAGLGAEALCPECGGSAAAAPLESARSTHRRSFGA